MQRHRPATIDEAVPLPGVEEAFRCNILRQQHVVARQFHMVVGDVVGRHLRDAAAVDQIAHRDQNAGLASLRCERGGRLGWFRRPAKIQRMVR